MKRLYRILTLIFVLGIVSPAIVAGGTSGHEQLLREAEQLLIQYKDNEALALYEQVLAMSADNLEALCKASQLHCRIGDRFVDDTRKMEHFTKAKRYAARAYELNPVDAETNYAMATSLAYIAKVSGPKQRLTVTNQIKLFADAALLNNEQHAGAWHMLGRWHFKMANLNFAETAASKLFFGGVCDVASNADAVEALQQAIRYNPRNMQYYFDLASIYHELKNKEACIDTLQQALTLSFETKEELELSRRCKLMLQDLMK